MTAVAISYRRSDSSVFAGRICDHLAAHYGRQAVFMDIDNIPFGVDFRVHIQETFKHTDVLLALIGTNWLGRKADGVTRMQEATDPVRVEIETAVQCKIPIIPVLLDGAKMPESSRLPATFSHFAYLNAAEVSSKRDFRIHMERLIGAIDRILGPSTTTVVSEPPRVNESARQGSADGQQFGSTWLRDSVRYFVIPLLALLAAHYPIVNMFNLNTNYLWLACAVLPFAAGFALCWVSGGGAGVASIFALALGLVGVSGMSISESLYSGDPMLPRSRFEWLDNFQFAAAIALSFMVGYFVARGLRAFVSRKSGRTQKNTTATI